MITNFHYCRQVFRNDQMHEKTQSEQKSNNGFQDAGHDKATNIPKRENTEAELC